MVPIGYFSTKPRNGNRSLTGAWRTPVGTATPDAGPPGARPPAVAGSAASRRRPRPRPGGGAFGTGIGSDASLLGRPWVRDATEARGRPASRTARRLIGPRTGARATKTQPTWGTGLPPTSRP